MLNSCNNCNSQASSSNFNHSAEVNSHIDPGSQNTALNYQIPQPPQPQSCFTNTLTIVGLINAAWIIVGTIAYWKNNLHLAKISLAGITVGGIGTGIYLVQRRAYHKGSRGAQIL